MIYFSYSYVFFFQAEDGIRDGHVTGVQTCALPICSSQLTFQAFCGNLRACGVAEDSALDRPSCEQHIEPRDHPLIIPHNHVEVHLEGQRIGQYAPLTDKLILGRPLRVNRVHHEEDQRHDSHSAEQNAESCVDRKSTRLNSSHVAISYAVFCLKKKKTPRAEDCSR